MNPSGTRASLLLVPSAVFLAAFASGCGGDCSGDFCVEVLSSSYLSATCPSDTGKSCTFAAVNFSATQKGNPVSDPAELSASMTVNDRDVGVEGASELLSGESRLAVTLVLDRSFSVSQSGSTEAVRSAVLKFIDALPAEANIRTTAFASEAQVPEYIGENCEKNVADFLDKEKAKKLVTDCYAPHATQSSDSQTKLYDAVGGLLPGPKTSPNVVLVFTDGVDTASTQIKTPEEALQKVHDVLPTARVYAIGLGAEPNEQALKALSEDRFFRAEDSASLDKAFASVSSDLRTILTFRVIVAAPEGNAQARLKVKRGNDTVEKSFELGF